MNKKISLLIIIVFLAFSQEGFSSQYLTVQDIHKLPSEPATQRLRYGNAPQQFGDLRLPSGSGPFPVVIIIHGGCWLSKFANLTIMNPLATALTKAGVATWNIEYRTVDQPGGGWPGTFEDVSNAIDYLQTIGHRYNLNLDDVIILGHSAGGHLALWAAARSKLPQDSPLYSSKRLLIRGVIDLSGPGSLSSFYPMQVQVCDEKVITKMLGGSPTQKPERYHQASPIELLPLGVKQILITSADDPDVPPSLGREYQLTAQKAGDTVEFIIIKNAAHFEPISPQSNAWPAIKKSVFDLLNIK